MQKIKLMLLSIDSACRTVEGYNLQKSDEFQLNDVVGDRSRKQSLLS